MGFPDSERSLISTCFELVAEFCKIFLVIKVSLSTKDRFMSFPLDVVFVQTLIYHSISNFVKGELLEVVAS